MGSIRMMKCNEVKSHNNKCGRAIAAKCVINIGEVHYRTQHDEFGRWVRGEREREEEREGERGRDEDAQVSIVYRKMEE